MHLMRTSPRWLVGLLIYLWSVPILVATLWIFDLRFEYDRDLLFWVIAAYILPVGAIKEVSGLEFGTSLTVYLSILSLASACLVRAKRNTDRPA